MTQGHPPEPFWTRRDSVAFLIPFLGALTVYLFSLPPTVTLEDAGELVVAADYLGVPHPPGYPLWTVLAWFFQWIFHFVTFRGYPNPAWPVALMSAVFGSLACGVIGVCAAKLSRSLWSPSRPTGSAMSGSTSRLVGAGAGLLSALLLQTRPVAGGVGLRLLTTLFLLTLIIQGLTPARCLQRVLSRLPSLPALGHGFWGFALGVVCYATVWSGLLNPAPGPVLALATTGVLILLLLSSLLRVGVIRARTRPDLFRDCDGGFVDVWIGAGAGLLLAFTPLMYSQSVIVEVYSLNAFFLALLLLLVLRYLHRPDPSVLLLTGFLFALGLTNHQSLLFLVFFLVAGVAAAGNRALLKDGLFLIGLGALGFALLKARQYHQLDDPDARGWFLLLALWVGLLLAGIAGTRGGVFTTWRTLAALVLLGALGLGFHLYMPVASDQNPPMNWGNARTFEGFRHALTRGQYKSFGVADNVRNIADTMGTPVDPAWTAEEHAPELNRSFARRTLFPRMLGAYIHNPDWKYSIANQFSLQLSEAEADPTGTAPPPRERQIPLALIGLLPLLVFSAFPPRTRGWFISSMVAMFFLTVVFLVVQWPELNHNDLWVKRVQYVQAHVLFAVWMGLGAALLTLLLYGLLPWRRLPPLTAAPLCALFIAFPLWKEGNDPRHLEHLGSSSRRGHDFGWQFGVYQLRGANGILLDELAHHGDPDCGIDDWAAAYLTGHGLDEESLRILRAAAGDQVLPRSIFRKRVLRALPLSKEQKRKVEEAAMLAAFRTLPPEEQKERLVYLHRPLPDWDYPAEMEPNAILFGGTDPGRFVPTYLIFSADVRSDVFLITQTALADGTYQDTLRDLYGDRIALPDFLDANQAFLDYANELRLFHPQLYARVMGGGDTMSVSGVSEVNRINARLTRHIVDRNAHAHAFYFEEAISMPWMVRHLRPNGLIFKLEPEPVDLLPSEIRRNAAFWDWMEEHLLSPAPDGKRNAYQRNLPVRKSFSKLRMSQAWNFHQRGHHREAVAAMEQALRLYPANPEAAVRAGNLFMRIGDFERANRILAEFAPHDPANRRLIPFARSLRALEGLDAERVQLEKDLSMKSSGNTALQLLEIYARLERGERVREMADLVLRLPNLHPDFYAHLAGAMQRREDAAYYRKAVERWTEKAPEDYRPWIDRAAIALYDGDYTDMVRHMVRAVQLAPVDAREQLAQDARFMDIRHWTQFQKLIRQK